MNDLVLGTKIARLEKFIERLKRAGHSYFSTVGLKELADRLKNDPDFAACLSLLPSVEDKMVAIAKVEGNRGGGPDAAFMLVGLAGATDYLEGIALRATFLKKMGEGETPKIFSIAAWSPDLKNAGLGGHNTPDDRVGHLIDNCVMPIVEFIESNFNQTVRLFRSLERYKVLCEWYDRAELEAL